MTTNKTEKVYVNSLWFEEKSFGDGGSILKVNIKDTDELIKFIKENRKSDKSLKLVISKKQNIEEGKSTHYAYVDTWEPSNNRPASSRSASPSTSKPSAKKPVVAEEPEEQLI